MTGNFENAVTIIFEREGGHLSADEAKKQGDPGGETKFGISKRSYPELDISALTRKQAKDIYYNDYWKPTKCDFLDWPMCLFVFDSAVNQGTNAATRMMQKALGAKDDGVIGPITIDLMAQAGKWHAAKFMAIRARRYAETNNFDKFGEGWLIRLFMVAMEG